MKLINCKIIAEQIEREITESINGKNEIPVLKIILVGDNSDSISYVEMKKKMAIKLGINCVLIKLPKEASEAQLKSMVISESKTCDGLMIQLPLPREINEKAILDYIPVDKDVDGLNENSSFIPATVVGILSILNNAVADFKKKVIGVIGQSRIVGKSLSDELDKICDNPIIRMDKYTGISNSNKCDILVVATGVPNLIAKENIKKDTIIIDAGFTKNGKTILGDVNFESVKNKASLITPVPGGVGPVTVISLMKNLINGL